MAAPKDFLTGFNHNVRHKGRGFHVQTEDSGEEIAHVITHLFEGGNILASKKTSYAEIRGNADLKARVRSIMEEQHRQMLRQLVNGAFDGTSPGAAAPDAEGRQDDRRDAERNDAGGMGFLPPIAAKGGASRSLPEAGSNDGAAMPPRGLPAPRPEAPAPRPEAPSRRPAPVLERSFVPPPAAAEPTPGPSSWSPRTQVLWPTADEAAARNASAAGVRGPPVPGAAERASHAPAVDRTLAPAHPHAATDRASGPPGPTAPLRPIERTPGPPNWRPPPAPIETIFGEEPGAEKSLDEVILRYLAGERE